MDRVCSDHTPVIITRNRDQSVVMLSLEDFEAHLIKAAHRQNRRLQFFDRTAGLLSGTLNATSAAFQVAGCKGITATITAGAITERAREFLATHPCPILTKPLDGATLLRQVAATPRRAPRPPQPADLPDDITGPPASVDEFRARLADILDDLPRRLRMNRRWKKRPRALQRPRSFAQSSA